MLTHSTNLFFGPKSSFKNQYWSRAGFELQNEVRLQLWGGSGATVC